jgi:large repetitive protein
MQDLFAFTLAGLAAITLSADSAISGTEPEPGGATRPIFTLRGSAGGTRFGAAVAGAGDIDGDGHRDVIVGAPMEAIGGIKGGTARIFSGRDASELYLFAGDTAFDRFGASVSGGRDLDGDSIPDLLIGAPTGTPPEGSVSAFSGRSGKLLWRSRGDSPGDRFGHACALLGDLDGDGLAEVLIGAPYADGNGQNAGLVVLLSGADGERLREFRGEAWDFFGKSVSGAGDLDGDGFEELICGAPLADVGAFNSGSVRVLSGKDGSLLHSFHGAAIGDQLGERVRGGMDIDGDGFPELLLGAPGADRSGIDSGVVQVRSGANGGLLFEVPGSAEGQYLGTAFDLGNLGGDERAELLVGVPEATGAGEQSGRLRISSAEGAPLLSIDGYRTNDWFGASVAALGDLDGDGRGDFAVGAPGHDDHPSVIGYVQVFSGRTVPEQK